MDEAVLDYVRGLPGGSHAFCPFDSPISRDQVFVEYVRGAVERNLRVVHLSDDVARDLRLISENEIRETVPGQVNVVPIEEAYNPATYSPQMALEFWTNQSKKAENAGFAGLRGSADDTILARWGLFSKLIESERVFGRTMFSENFTVLCMYDAGALELGTVLTDLLAAHRHVIFPGLAMSLI